MSRALLPGRATADGTAALAGRFAAAGRRLGRSELIVAPIGFGGYRIHPGEAQHRQALEEALRAGFNLIDTSAVYSGGGSEVLIGEVLATLVIQEVIARSQVVVVTKLGYLQGPNLEAARRRALGYPEVARYLPECWHCIHPEFLDEQLGASQIRLGLEVIDVLLLHNPEYFLIDRRNRAGEVTDDDREELYRRIAGAFTFLEEAVASGRIGAYGVSSNALGAGVDDPDFVSLARLGAIAREVGGDDHHFAVIEAPLNLYEGGALRERQPTDEGLRTLIEIAALADLGVLTNRPLSAFVQGDGDAQVIRLAEVGPAREDGRTPDPAPLLRAVCELESAWREGLGRDLAERTGDPRYTDLFRWGAELEQGMGALRDLGHWLQLRNGVIATHMGQLGGILLSSLEGDELVRFRRFWEDYGSILGAALDGIEDVFRARAQAVVDLIGDRLGPALPPGLRGLPLSQRAVLVAAAAPVSAVLVGMRRPAYVHDMAALGPVIDGLADGELTIDVPRALDAFAPPAIH